MDEPLSTPAPVDAPDGEAIITLRTPVEFAGETYRTMRLSEPTAGAWEATDGLDGLEFSMRGLSIASGLPYLAIGLIRVRDIRDGIAALGRMYLDVDEVKPGPEESATERTITLRKPVVLGETYTELRLREPTATEWRAFDHLSGAAADMKAVATITGLPDVVVRQIGIRDLRTAARWLGRFFDNAPATGAAS